MPKFKIKCSLLYLEAFYLEQILTMNKEKSLTLWKDIKSSKGVRYQGKLSIAQSRLLYSVYHIHMPSTVQVPGDKRKSKSVHTP